MAYEVGDWTTPTLTVTPADGTTAAALTIVAPDGTSTPATPTSANTGATWAAPAYELTQPGEWVEQWTVTGTGKSRERRILLVAPDPTDVPSGARVYATTADYAKALRKAPPAGSRQALAEASQVVDDMLLTAVYPVDTNGLPTTADHIRTLRDATCAQAEDARTHSAASAGSFSIGRLSVTKAAPSKVEAERYRSPRAYRILSAGGLTGQGPQEPVGYGLV